MNTDAPSSTAPDPETGGFADLGLPEPVVRALDAQGLTTPFPVQAAAIPDALAGRDVLARGRTGSGKTLAFGLPMLTLTARDVGRRVVPNSPHALVLTPTRELAMQVTEALQPFAKVLGLRMGTVVGGEPYKPQIAMLERGVHVLIATPGRLQDLVGQRQCGLARVRIAVLDEADQMADTGFLPDVVDIWGRIDPRGQRMLFSATLDDRVEAVVRRFMADAVTHSADPVSATVPDMVHHAWVVRPADKGRVTAALASRPGRALLFVRSREGADRTAAELRSAGVRAAALHGGKPQPVRNRTLEEFREGTRPVLVATDVAARGIHVEDVDLVVHVDPPHDHRDYLHRAGRTARAGASGTVVTLALPSQVKTVRALLRHVGLDIEPVEVRPGSPALEGVLGEDGAAVAEDRGTPALQTAPPRRRRRRTRRPAEGSGTPHTRAPHHHERPGS